MAGGSRWLNSVGRPGPVRMLMRGHTETGDPAAAELVVTLPRLYTHTTAE